MRYWSWASYNMHQREVAAKMQHGRFPRAYERPLLTNLHDFSTAECYDARDRIYSLLSISTHIDEHSNRVDSVVSPDYALSVDTLYLRLAVTYATSRRYATTLLACAAARASVAPSARALPSWVTDWRLSPQYQLDAVPERPWHFCAPGSNCAYEKDTEGRYAECPSGLSNTPLFSADCRTLRIMGVLSRSRLEVHSAAAEAPDLTERQTYLLLEPNAAFKLELVSGGFDHVEEATFRLLPGQYWTRDESEPAAGQRWGKPLDRVAQGRWVGLV